MNISVGLVLETLQELNHKEDHRNSPFQPYNRPNQNSVIDQILLGTYYQYVVFGFSFVTIFITVYHRFEPFDMDFEVLGCSLDDVAYTLHFMMLLIRHGKIFTYERESLIMMFVHFLSGYTTYPHQARFRCCSPSVSIKPWAHCSTSSNWPPLRSSRGSLRVPFTWHPYWSPRHSASSTWGL